MLEDVGLKQRIFADLEKACRPDCILSTNTSTIDISLIGAKTRAADRIVGAHFFSPAHIMPLLEIVRTDKTSSQVRAQPAHRLLDIQEGVICAQQQEPTPEAGLKGCMAWEVAGLLCVFRTGRMSSPPTCKHDLAGLPAHNLMLQAASVVML